MTSIVLISTFIRIPVPVLGMHTMIHLGNAACILSGLLIGPTNGGIASGTGSFIFDILTPGYITSAPFTFLFKFIMGYVCGCVSKTGKDKNLLAAVLGTSSYIILQAVKNFLKNMFFLGIPIQANIIILGKGLIVPIINAAIAITVAVPLSKLLKNEVPKI